MTKRLLSAMTLCTLGLMACDRYSKPAPVDPNQRVLELLEGKTLVMQGQDIPTEPNGHNENINLEGLTMCFSHVTLQVTGGTFNLTSVAGTLRDAPNRLDVGHCDRETPGPTTQISTLTSRVENAKQDLSCFDLTFTFPGGLTQEGRASLSPDGKTLRMEMFLSGEATGHRCADGAVGSRTVKFNGQDFSGNAVQTFRAP